MESALQLSCSGRRELLHGRAGIKLLNRLVVQVDLA